MMDLIFTFYSLTVIVSYLVWTMCKKFFGNKNSAKNKLPPCIPSLPIVGSLPFISNLERFHIYIMEKSKTLGNVIALYMGDKYIVVLNGRKTINEAFVKKAFNFASRPKFFLSSAYNPNQKGIVEHPYDDEFKIYHRASLNILKNFGLGHGIMEMRIKSEIEYFVQAIKLKKGQPFDPSLDVIVTFFNIIGRMMYGKRWSVDDPEFLQFKEISELMVRYYILNFFPILRYVPYFKGRFRVLIESIQSSYKLIEKNIKLALNNKSVETFCNSLDKELKNISNESKKIDDEQLKVMARDLTVAGTETSSNTILWFIYFMANHQDIQKQLRDELNRVVGSNRLPCSEDRPNLPITEASLLEVMRIRTLVPLAAPHLTLKESVIDGIYIPSGVVVLANLYSAHMDPDVWDEPEKFKIERFLNENRTEVINRDHVISFSLGKRSCLGEPLARQELFLFASTVIHQFQILPPEGQSKVVAKEIFGSSICPTPFNVRLVERV